MKSSHTTFDFLKNIDTFAPDKAAFLKKVIDRFSHTDVSLDHSVFLCQVALQIEEMYLHTRDLKKRKLICDVVNEKNHLQYSLEAKVTISPPVQTKTNFSLEGKDIKLLLNTLYYCHTRKEHRPDDFEMPYILSQMDTPSHYTKVHHIIGYPSSKFVINMMPTKKE
jgi:hypothetical protein